MCGVAGYCGLDDRELLGAMTGALAHRGPDDSGLWTDSRERVGLGHRRLAILDLAPRGRQPMTNEDGSVRVVFNGEIYNYVELRAELLARGHTFSSETDTEVLVHLYEDEGELMLSRLNGIYAFAIWDARKRELLLARDPLGVKPLYYAIVGERLVFASELKAVALAPFVPLEVDLRALHDYLTFLWAPSPATMLRHVRKLEPGAALRFAGGRVVKRWRHYELPVACEPVEGGEDAVWPEVRRRLRRAVERQLVADVPVGAFLSGGLDSSSIVAMMRQSQPGVPIRCYTAGAGAATSEEGFGDDLSFARRVAAHLGADLVEVPVQTGLYTSLEKMIWLLDEPQADPAGLIVLAIAERARADGVKVLLSGAGGDDLFSGYRRHLALELERLWARLPAFVLRMLASLARRLPAGQPALRRLRKAFAQADLPPAERLLGYFSWADESVRRGLYSEATRAALAGHDTFAGLRRTLGRLPAGLSALERMLYLETKHFLPDHNLNYTDKMSMAAGVEVRVPFLDVDLVELAAAVPPGLKQHGLTGKYVLKRAMEGLLPRDVIHRPKTGFGAPVRRWVARELDPMIGDLLSRDSMTRRGWFDADAVSRLVDANRKGEVDAGYIIFSLLCLETWGRCFLDRARLKAAA